MFLILLWPIFWIFEMSQQADNSTNEEKQLYNSTDQEKQLYKHNKSPNFDRYKLTTNIEYLLLELSKQSYCINVPIIISMGRTGPPLYWQL